jgi:hypothetical protein
MNLMAGSRQLGIGLLAFIGSTTLGIASISATTTINVDLNFDLEDLTGLELEFEDGSPTALNPNPELGTLTITGAIEDTNGDGILFYLADPVVAELLEAIPDEDEAAFLLLLDTPESFTFSATSTSFADELNFTLEAEDLAALFYAPEFTAPVFGYVALNFLEPLSGNTNVPFPEELQLQALFNGLPESFLLQALGFPFQYPVGGIFAGSNLELGEDETGFPVLVDLDGKAVVFAAAVPWQTDLAAAGSIFLMASLGYQRFHRQIRQ